MTEYIKMAMEAREKVTRLTLEQQKDILDMYEEVIEGLASKAGEAKSETLTKRWLTDYLKEVAAERRELQKKLNKAIKDSANIAARHGTSIQLQMFAEIQKLGSIDLGPHFKDMFSKVPKDVIESIVSGELYKDGRSLSQRIWILGNDLGKDVQYIINQGILEKKSAIELAQDLEKYVKEPARRSTTWGKTYPNLRSKRVDYNAQRLARTAINHAYQEATRKSSAMNPFVEGIEWQSALIHDRTCEVCRDRHGQVFPIDKVPLDHPNGLCTMIPVIEKSLDDIAEELRDWIDGGNNSKLDKWYSEHGDYFALKKL